MNTGGMPGAMRGAVDLGALAAAREAQQKAEERIAERGAASGGDVAAVVTELTEQNFQTDLLDRSFEVPVVVAMWTPRSEPSIQVIATLKKLAIADDGKWLVGTVNVDESQQIAAAFQVQGVPTLIAMIKGQPVPLVQGAIEEADARALIDQLLDVAQKNELSGRVAIQDNSDAEASGEVELEEPSNEVDPMDVHFDAAADAYDRQDWGAATAAYQAVLGAVPNDPDAKAGLARVELMQELDGADFAEVMSAAANNPHDVATGVKAANVEFVSGEPVVAFDRLIELVRVNQGDERNSARDHLVKLFDLVGATPEVAQARTNLANALF